MDQIMQQTVVEKSEIKLVGISVRTSYEQELNLMNSQIFPCVQRYFHGALFEKIPNRSKPGITFCAYTDYESDYRGGYTYFIGDEVSEFDEVLPEGFQKLTIPKQLYVKFTTNPDPMPDVLVKACNTIWNTKGLNEQRCYHTDFELYDERAADEQKVVLDIFVGIR